MSTPAYREIIRDGLWKNNSGLVQLLGLCPLLAVTTTAINGLGLGLATTLTLLTSNVIVSLIRTLVRPEVRIPVFVLVIASTVTVIDLETASASKRIDLGGPRDAGTLDHADADAAAAEDGDDPPVWKGVEAGEHLVEAIRGVGEIDQDPGPEQVVDRFEPAGYGRIRFQALGNGVIEGLGDRPKGCGHI